MKMRRDLGFNPLSYEVLGEAIRPKARSSEGIIEPKSASIGCGEEASEWKEKDEIPLAQLQASWKAEKALSVVVELPVKLQLRWAVWAKTQE